jgi:hypothetical protein
MPPPPQVVQDQANDPQQQAANIMAAINLERLQVEQALVKLGMTEVSAREFPNNGITSLVIGYAF